MGDESNLFLTLVIGINLFPPNDRNKVTPAIIGNEIDFILVSRYYNIY